MSESRPYLGRKYKVIQISLILITGGFLATALFPALAASYGTFVMAVGAAAGLYQGGNVAETYVTGKKTAKAEPKVGAGAP
jgi:hypothetical protein